MNGLQLPGPPPGSWSRGRPGELEQGRPGKLEQGALAHPALPLARNAAVFTRFWQAVEQKRRVPLRETST
jgi:hypothetical protein